MSDACPLCDETAAAFMCAKNGFDIVRCIECGLVRVHPLPSSETLSAYYKAGYNQFVYSFATPSSDPPLRKSPELKVLEKYCQTGTLLDVGAAHGHFMVNAQRHGWKVTGVEPQDEARTDAQSRFHLTIFESLSETRDHDADAVTMWHVIEHIASPLDFLRNARSKLKVGGALALATPNVDSLVARATGESWGWLSPPDHVYLYSPKTLPRLLEQAGFDVLHVETRQGESRNFLILMLQALAYRLGLFSRMKRSVQRAAEQVHTTDSLTSKLNFFYVTEKVTDVLSYALYPVLIILYRKGLGDEVLAVARRKENV